jgi:SpoVK/Ycf46/Vps4 family AAA+-type ATPase
MTSRRTDPPSPDELDAETREQLSRVVDRVAASSRDRGVRVLFSGRSGTGRTRAAEILADELDRPLHRIDLSQVVSKYIGETEKNLRELLAAAESTDVILFFDEADSLFGTRSESADDSGRHANTEVSYLLEWLEAFPGTVILSANRTGTLAGDVDVVAVRIPR